MCFFLVWCSFGSLTWMQTLPVCIFFGQKYNLWECVGFEVCLRSFPHSSVHLSFTIRMLFVLHISCCAVHRMNESCKYVHLYILAHYRCIRLCDYNTLQLWRTRNKNRLSWYWWCCAFFYSLRFIYFLFCLYLCGCAILLPSELHSYYFSIYITSSEE